MTAALSAAHEAIEAIQAHEAWALIRRSTRAGERESIGAVGGKRWIAESLLDIPLETGVPEAGKTVDRLVAVPFRQITERGFHVHDDGTPLVVVDIETEFELSVAEVLDALPDSEIEFTDRGGFGTSDEAYETIVEQIINEEIGQGEGANLVIGRHYRAVVADWDTEKALTVFRRLLERERGAYWTFCFFTGDRYLIGATPERHVSMYDGDVKMNPISGTFRLPKIEAETAEEAAAALKPQLLDFLRDEKEIYELYMVVDEELKMMCEICNEGGQVLGPFLKPMSRLIHTEYLLAGRSNRDPREVLRDTMYAATVTGSPVENACRLIKEYETEGRGYYSAALAIFGRDNSGAPVLDSPILLRTADVSVAGELKVSAGATLVRDSDPAYEVAETHTKAAGILGAFGLVPAAPAASLLGVPEVVADEDILIELNRRNRRLSSFWLNDQSPDAGDPIDPDKCPDPALVGKHAVILDGEDDFAKMIRHILGVFGMTSTLVRHEEFSPEKFDGADLVIVGPGPGDPRDDNDAKMGQLRAAVAYLLENKRPFMSVCLGHQALCHQLGIPLAVKDIVFQGTQAAIPFTLGGRKRTERVGFYNTFVGRVGDNELPEGVTVDVDPTYGDIHAIHGPHFEGIQFHAESILTERGFDLLHELVSTVLN